MNHWIAAPRVSVGAGALAAVWLYTVVAATGAIVGTALAVTPDEVSSSCGPCHGLTANGVVVSAGEGSLGVHIFRDSHSQVTWRRIVNDMVRQGAEVSDVEGTAAYLANLGGSSATPTGSPMPTASPTPGTPPPLCQGDCDANGTVTISELITAVNIALSTSPLSACQHADPDDVGDVQQIIVAVTNALIGCPGS